MGVRLAKAMGKGSRIKFIFIFIILVRLLKGGKGKTELHLINVY